MKKQAGPALLLISRSHPRLAFPPPPPQPGRSPARPAAPDPTPTPQVRVAYVRDAGQARQGIEIMMRHVAGPSLSAPAGASACRVCIAGSYSSSRGVCV